MISAMLHQWGSVEILISGDIFYIPASRSAVSKAFTLQKHMRKYNKIEGNSHGLVSDDKRK
jgi:hypothetical protein